MTYIVVGAEIFPVDFPEETKRAKLALKNAGLDKARVWVTPADKPFDKAFQSEIPYQSSVDLFVSCNA